MMHQLFTSATFKLTVWYLAIVMVLSISFSLMIYHLSSEEISRDFPTSDPSAARFLPLQVQIIRQIREHQAEESNARLRLSLVLLNLGTLALGGYASYALARWTLQPIEAAVAAQTRFTSDASHELRTPLTTMRTELEVALKHKKLTRPQLYHQLQSSLDDVISLQELTDRLLQLAQGKDLVVGPVSLSAVATAATNRFIPRAQAAGITIDNTVREAIVQGNHAALADCLGILLDNAIKYSQRGTVISLASAHTEREAVITVTDTGSGITADNLPHVFDRFYRSDNSRTKDERAGFGLGLSIAKRLVELHRGTIAITSEAGLGTTVSVRLERSPRVDSADTLHKMPSPRPPAT